MMAIFGLVSVILGVAAAVFALQIAVVLAVAKMESASDEESEIEEPAIEFAERAYSRAA